MKLEITLSLNSEIYDEHQGLEKLPEKFRVEIDEALDMLKSRVPRNVANDIHHEVVEYIGNALDAMKSYYIAEDLCAAEARLSEANDELHACESDFRIAFTFRERYTASQISHYANELAKAVAFVELCEEDVASFDKEYEAISKWVVSYIRKLTPA